MDRDRWCGALRPWGLALAVGCGPAVPPVAVAPAWLAHVEQTARPDAERPVLSGAPENDRVVCGENTLKYSILRKGGERPEAGWPLYIALHGGGSAPAAVNDQQWVHMQGYYAESIETGLYVAPRGITDDWNLHFRRESYVLYDLLIERLIAEEGVDPDRVYLLGFSAGGDGVYQLAVRLSDRLAAASMSAGHPNGVSLVNLHGVPFLVQMGERDTAFERHRSAAQTAERLAALQAADPDGYVHTVHIHEDGDHNRPWSDHDPSGRLQPVLADPVGWLADPAARETVLVDANAVHWLDQHHRRPWPRHVVWEPGVAADRDGRERRSHWLRLDPARVEAPMPAVLSARWAPESATFHVEQGAPGLCLLVPPRLVEKPVTVVVDGRSTTLRPGPSPEVVARSLAERGDQRMVAGAELCLERQGDRLMPRS